ncbi:hypothetical protein PR048_024911 [Dryococelus australis]|uniref:Uncharacterized protein n=1 Tax=Dryococelus australis TaxID=614101 RepID=A0ABQ9GPW4_9NEOP|nr:hypothetical protein PR048_024911 [Dryococelus australis]
MLYPVAPRTITLGVCSLHKAGCHISLASNTYVAIMVGLVEARLVRKHYILPLSTPATAFTCSLQSEARRIGMRATSPARRRWRRTVDEDSSTSVPVLQCRANTVDEVVRSVTAMRTRWWSSRTVVTLRRPVPARRCVRPSSIHWFHTRITVAAACPICDEKGIPHPFSNNKTGKDWFYGFMRRNNDTVLRKAENLSKCRLMRFNKEIFIGTRQWTISEGNLGNLQFRNLFTEAWTQAATPKNAMSGFRATGIFPFNPQIIPEIAFALSDVSDRTPLQARPTCSSATSCTFETSTIPATPTAPSTSNNTPTTSTSLATVHSLIPKPEIIRNLQKTRQSLNFSKGVHANADQPSTAPVHKHRVRIRTNNDDMHCGDCGRNYYDKSMKVPWIQCVECKRLTISYPCRMGRGSKADSASASPRLTGFYYRRGYFWFSHEVFVAGRRRWSEGFLVDLPFPPPLHFGTALCRPCFTLITSQDLCLELAPSWVSDFPFCQSGHTTDILEDSTIFVARMPSSWPRHIGSHSKYRLEKAGSNCRTLVRHTDALDHSAIGTCAGEKEVVGHTVVSGTVVDGPIGDAVASAEELDDTFAVPVLNIPEDPGNSGRHLGASAVDTDDMTEEEEVDVTSEEVDGIAGTPHEEVHGMTMDLISSGMSEDITDTMNTMSTVKASRHDQPFMTTVPN